MPILRKVTELLNSTTQNIVRFYCVVFIANHDSAIQWHEGHLRKKQKGNIFGVRPLNEKQVEMHGISITDGRVNGMSIT